MASIFNDEEKASIESILSDVHDTFQKDVYVFIEEVTSIDLSDDSFNPLYGRSLNQAKAPEDKVLTKYTVQARVFYYRYNTNEIIEDIGLPSSENIVRLKIDEDAKELIKNASVVEIDESLYSVVADPEAVGPFQNKYWKVYLKRDA